MRVFIFICILGGAALFATHSIEKTKNPLVPLFTSWCTTLIIINMITGYFLFYFDHSIKSKNGEEGLQGLRGLRGEEGMSAQCEFKCK
tara:strand:- start:48 stop:311 length:264 start_codon:yes stop_codon:yes gene_type:complete